MPQYQNLFTQIQVEGPADLGIPLDREIDQRERGTTTWHLHLLGRIGNAQIGPFYLGFLGVASIFFFVIGSSL
ncbi:MAG: hypothetical protein ACO3QP_03915 [Burkholderiaceae bacterium]